MREILFRGKQVFTCAWVEGTGIFADGINTWISYNKPNKPIAYGLKHNQVYTETVGQFTGLTDKNGKKIFEGDILKDDWGKIYKVFFTTKSCSFMVECTVTQNEWETGNYRIGEAWCGTVRVIGNIHDNPELLEVKNGN